MAEELLEVDLRKVGTRFVRHLRWAFVAGVIAAVIAWVYVVMFPAYASRVLIGKAPTTLPELQKLSQDLIIVAEVAKTIGAQKTMTQAAKNFMKESTRGKVLEKEVALLPNVKNPLSVALTVRADDPDYAAAMAKKWATLLLEQDQKRINSALSRRVAELQADLEFCKEEYEREKQKYEQFTEGHNVPAKEVRLESAKLAYADALETQHELALSLKQQESLEQQHWRNLQDQLNASGLWIGLLVQALSGGDNVKSLGQGSPAATQPKGSVGLQTLRTVQALAEQQKKLVDHQIKEDMPRITALVDAQKSLLTNILRQQSDLAAELQGAQTSLEIVEKGLDQLNKPGNSSREGDQLSATRDALMRQRGFLRVQKDALHERLSYISDKINKTTEELGENSGKLLRATGTKNALLKTISVLEAQYDDHRRIFLQNYQEYLKAKVKRSLLEAELNKNKELIEQLDKEISQLEAELPNLKQTVERQTARLEETTNRWLEISGELTNIEAYQKSRLGSLAIIAEADVQLGRSFKRSPATRVPVRSLQKRHRDKELRSK